MGTPLTGASNADGVGKKIAILESLAIDRWLVECDQQLRRLTMQFTTQTARWWCISESVFITTSMDYYDEEKRTDQNLFVRSGKSEAEEGK